MSRFPIFLLLLLMSTSLRGDPYTAIKDGESFRFKAGWGVFTSAAEITVSAKKDVREGRSVFRISMTTVTKGVVGGLYPYKEEAEAIIDEETGRLIVATDKADNGDQSIDSTMTFNYETREATFRDKKRPGRNTDLKLPEGDPVDLISALIEARSWASKPGEKRSAVVFAGRDVYPINIYAENFEKIQHKGKDVEALVLVPKMEEQSPRGIFKKGGQVKVWVAQNGSRLPIKMQLRLNFGTATLTLVEHKNAAGLSLAD